MGYWGTKAFALGIVAASLLFSSAVFAQSGPAGACDAPVKLDYFYNLIGSGWHIRDASLQGDFLILFGEKLTPAVAKYTVWVQPLGSNHVLDSADIPNLVHVGNFSQHPLGLKISKSGWLALWVDDPNTAGRSVPYSPTAQVSMDRVLVTCHFAACESTVQWAERFTPRDNPYYPSNPPVNFMVDGMVTQFLWEDRLGQPEALLYSYVQYENNMIQSPPWLRSIPSPLPPLPTPSTGIVRFDPASGFRDPIYVELTPSNSGNGFTLSTSIQGRFEKYWVQHANSVSMTSNFFTMDYSIIEPDTSPNPSQSFMQTPLSAWNQNPATPGFTTWNAMPMASGAAVSYSPQNGMETIAISTVLERNGSTPTMRDVVFRSSLNGFQGQDHYLEQPDDGRDIKKVLVLDHPTPSVPGANRSFAFAVESTVGQWGAPTTDVYVYQPSFQSGVIGQFSKYKTVVTAPGELFRLQNGSEEHLVGWVDRVSPFRRDVSLVHCP